MLRRGQALAFGGAEMLLSELDPRVGYRGGTLELNGPTIRSWRRVDAA